MAACKEAKQRKLDNEVQLGFAEEIDEDDAVRKLQMTSSFFPSKIGGRPAWLNLQDLPDSDRMLCKVCWKPMVFLLQVYAPLTNDQGFHRTIYLFCCKDGNCHAKNNRDGFLVLRNQLKRDNKFYNFNPPPDLDEMSELSLESVGKEFRPKAWTSLCDVCGCLGSKTCSKCHMTRYCSREHQSVDWKSGHKSFCAMFLCSEEEFTPEQLFEGNLSLWLMWYHDGWQPRKRRMAKVVHIFSVIIPTQVQANSSGAEFLLRQIQVHEENDFCHCLFTSFTKREIRHFHG